jgi:hypothetical protein
MLNPNINASPPASRTVRVEWITQTRTKPAAGEVRLGSARP